MSERALILANAEEYILSEIADKSLRRIDVAKTYALAIRSESATGEGLCWAKINRAIIERWSRSGLEWIKQKAWSGRAFA